MPPVPPPAKRRGRAVRRAGTAAAGAAIAASYAVAGRLAPERSARAAARLWCRLPRNRGRRMDNRPSPGEVTRLEVVPGRSLAVEAWGPADGPLVYLNHGWGGWRGQVASFVAPLVRAGCRVIAADCLSHGDADPGRHGPGYSSGGEMVRSLEALVRHYGPARAAIGHSLGCATTCLAAAHGALRAERLVLVAASPAMRRLAREHGRRLHLPSHVIGHMLEAMDTWSGEPITDFDIARLGAAGGLPPTLIIHDRRDKEVPYQEAAGIARAWDGPHQFITTDGYGHHRILIAPDVVGRVVDFVLG